MSEQLQSQTDDAKAQMGASIDVVQNTLENFLATATIERVYGEPHQHGDNLIIPTAEVLVGLGFGAGFGYGSGSSDSEDEEEAQSAGEGGGAGGGGGGRTLSRPVAVIISSPEGVRVEPVVDLTKIGLAALTAWGFIFATLLRMRKPKKAMRDFKT